MAEMMQGQTIIAGTEETLTGCSAVPSYAATSSYKVAADSATDAGFLISRGKISNHSTTTARLTLETCMRCVAVVVLALRVLTWPEIACSVPDMTPVKGNVTGVLTRERGGECGDDDALRRKGQGPKGAEAQGRYVDKGVEKERNMSFLMICMLAGPLSVGLCRKSLGILLSNEILSWSCKRRGAFCAHLGVCPFVVCSDA